nr:MAG TPA: hypothetical protein [Caudoviricetes sp.]
MSNSNHNGVHSQSGVTGRHSCDAHIKPPKELLKALV